MECCICYTDKNINFNSCFCSIVICHQCQQIINKTTKICPQCRTSWYQPREIEIKSLSNIIQESIMIPFYEHLIENIIFINQEFYEFGEILLQHRII